MNEIRFIRSKKSNHKYRRVQKKCEPKRHKALNAGHSKGFYTKKAEVNGSKNQKKLKLRCHKRIKRILFSFLNLDLNLFRCLDSDRIQMISNWAKKRPDFFHQNNRCDENWASAMAKFEMLILNCKNIERVRDRVREKEKKRNREKKISTELCKLEFPRKKKRTNKKSRQKSNKKLRCKKYACNRLETICVIWCQSLNGKTICFKLPM